ncbi:MAG: DNA/RNA nuclease SfsA [Dehalococcoidia bacterium]
MRLPPDLQPATFVQRLNRFAALVELDGRQVLAHVANSGRLRELLAPGRRVLLARRAGPHRKTAYDLQLVEMPEGLVSADARLPNLLVHEALLAGRLPEFSGYGDIRREVPCGDSRIDLMLSGDTGRCFIEVKSVTLVVDGRGLFPDAPTERGRRHVRSLMAARERGDRAAIVFVVQRADAEAFAPHNEADAAFGETLREAYASGVEAYAYRCRVTRREIGLAGAIPVVL